ncbi:UNVERIFIED_CONTAM: hypothetical protein FKN15_054144 [Acipenser sinensis]
METAKATIITQRPLLIVKKGDSAVLDCEQDGSDNTMSWYRQAPDKGLELIYYSAAPRSEERQQSIPDRFTAKRSVLKSFPLNIQTLQAEDSAVYFCVRLQTILQSPSSIVQFADTEARLACTVQGASNPYMYWYRQDSSGGIEMLFLSRAAGMVDESPIKDFTAQRTGSESLSLQTDSLSLNHTAVYYCAWSSHGD